MKKIIVLLAVVFLFSCKDDEPTILGSWYTVEFYDSPSPEYIGLELRFTNDSLHYSGIHLDYELRNDSIFISNSLYFGKVDKLTNKELILSGQIGGVYER